MFQGFKGFCLGFLTSGLFVLDVGRFLYSGEYKGVKSLGYRGCEESGL